MNLLPQVKELTINDGIVPVKAIKPFLAGVDYRVKRELDKLPLSDSGIEISLKIGDGNGEGYSIILKEQSAHIDADSARGAFYAVQTIKQLLRWESLPCLTIKDYPSFSYRGVYHDVTRGKVPSLKTLKKLVDMLCEYKINSLQLYVEHAYEFKECKKINKEKGALTAKELKELDQYCKDRFIDFIPSLATFGHMYEILQQPEYQKLRVIKDFKPSDNEWLERMQHHTIDPMLNESEILVKSLIDQYAQNFTSDFFNICCDETFDLRNYEKINGIKINEKDLYVNFVNKIIKHIKGKSKRVMMWADILLQYPETIYDIPEDTIFLNWDYRANPDEKRIETFKNLGRAQVVCPGTSSWNRLVENFLDGESNIIKTAEYGFKHGAIGILNTNWGDWGNPCSIELALYALTFGAEKSWSVESPIDSDYYKRVGEMVYGCCGAIEIIKSLSDLNSMVHWTQFSDAYSKLKNAQGQPIYTVPIDTLNAVQAQYSDLKEKIRSSCIRGDVKEEMLIALDGICLMAELSAKVGGEKVRRLISTRKWLKAYKDAWKRKNKKSELYRIEKMFKFMEKRSKQTSEK